MLLSQASRVDPSMLGQTNYPRRPLDWYPTEPRCTRALLKEIPTIFGAMATAWEPCCGNGAISKVLADEGEVRVLSTDIAEYDGFEPDALTDFFAIKNLEEMEALAGFIPATVVTNPPYGKDAEKFVRHALDLLYPHSGRLAVLLRSDWSAAKGRRDLFKTHPAYAGRINLLFRPRWIDPTPGVKSASPRFNYTWFCWEWNRDLDEVAADLYAE